MEAITTLSYPICIKAFIEDCYRGFIEDCYGAFIEIFIENFNEISFRTGRGLLESFYRELL